MVNDPHSQDTTPPGQPSKPVARISPDYPHDLPAILPGELVEAPRWIVWRYELDADGDAWTKKPINPRTGKSGAKSTDPRTWGTFAQAADRYEAGGFDGLMFALGDGFAGIDLDHCIDTDTGELGRVESKLLTFDAGVVVERFGTYAEVSPSGAGVRLMMRGELPVGGRKSRNVEMYCAARFFSITGARIAGDELVESTELLAAFHREAFIDEAATHRQGAPHVAPGAGPVLLDEAIIQKAHNAKNAAKFLALWNGDRSGYASGSEADLALVGVLAFYTSDEDQLDRLFRQSGLMREKWERDDYRARTIGKILSQTGRLMWTPASERAGAGGERRSAPRASATTVGDMPAIRKHYEHTEFGNADRLLDAHGGDMRYSEALGFTVWDGKRWRINDELQVREWANDVVRSIYAEAAEVTEQASKLAQQGDNEGAKSESRHAQSLLEFARRSSTDHMMKAMVQLVQPLTRGDSSIFDTHPMLFNCANGTIDLTTGQIREHSREDYLTQCSPVEYDPQASAPAFLRFLREIMLERDELVDYLHRAFGYSLSGSVKEQVWHLLVGEGSNGKTTLIEALEYVMGDYAATMEPESITITGARRDPAAPSPDMAKLKGCRFTKITETEEGARIAPARIKKLSGGDKLTARYLHRDIFEFYPTQKIWLYTNHRPEARETTHAFWRRVRYVPFELNLKDHPTIKKDEDLPDKLRAEAPGILVWLVAGCLRWQAEGLEAPAAMTDAANSYRADMDVLAAFLRDCCVVAPHCETKAGALYAAYKDWCEDNGEFAWKQRRFGQALNEKGFGSRKSHGDIVRTGVGLRDPNDPGPDGNWWDDDKPEPTKPSGGATGSNEPRGGQSNFNTPPPSAQNTSPLAESGEQGDQFLGVDSRTRASERKPLENGPRYSPAPPKHVSHGTLADLPDVPVEAPPGWAGEGYSATPPDKDAPCSKGGRHMWMVARGGSGFACKKCRPELVNRPR